MDRVEDRVGEERPAGREQPLAGGDQAVEIAVPGGDQDRHRRRAVGQVQRVLGQAEQEVGTGARSRGAARRDRRNRR